MKLAVDQINNWIFVTGVIRSGTTFAGKVLSLPIEVDNIHEPYREQRAISARPDLVPYVRPSIDTEEMQKYHEFTKRIFSYDLTMRGYYPEKDPWLRKVTKRLVGSRGPFYLRLAKINVFHKAAVIKDPVSLLLTEYLYLHFGVKPVIVIKHPVSLIASLKRVNWWPHPRELAHEQLIKDYFCDEADFMDRSWSTPMLASAAYWRAVHKVLLAQADNYPKWQVVTHEQLCQNPVSTFQHLYEVLGLPWSESVKRRILKLTQGSHSTEARKGVVQDFQRNSANLFEMRRDSLSLEERRAIFEVVEDVALKIYPKESFAID
ncbi:MAG: hypothetical protein BRC37_13340 [Cyanobacteria bacterium QH_3_48_40]|nr:MAG: hypothetical protein BRC35_15000 [Cyanobacteria bacterium QH_10_48_56]PSO71578.1 MAG: hypothetical protein BRC37_13340 [Cyanobacteria bacterium QH_3_48_40]